MLNHALIFEALRADLVRAGALTSDIIVGLERHFNPEAPEYVARVTSWQIFLCQGTSGDLLGGPLLVRAKVAQVWGDGFALSDNVPAIAAVHQIAMIFWKEEAVVPPDWPSYANRVSTSGRPDLTHPIIEKLAVWVKNLLGKAPSWDELVGRSGTGATADRKDAVSRWWFTHRPLGVDPGLYAYNARCDIPYTTDVIPTARASAVPKNRKSARIVASEPAAAVFAQLAVMNALDDRLFCLRRKVPIWNADMHRSFLVKNHREVATLDLSDASDYISMDLANAVLPADWAAIMNGCRSQAVRLPDGSIVPLATFAPMGNGFCFRFLSVICAGLLAVCCRKPWSDFGDDQICHRSEAPFVANGLKAAGLVLNETKSCYGRYIESCGLELLDGYDITPLKIKKLLTFKGDYCDLAAAHRAACRDLSEVAKVLCQRWDFPVRYNRRLQRLEWRCPIWHTAQETVDLDEYPGMLRWYTNFGTNYRSEASLWSRTVPGFDWLCVDPTQALLPYPLPELGPRTESDISA